MGDKILTQIHDRYQLEMQLLRLERKAAEAEVSARQAKFDLRSARQERTLYQSSFRSFRDKLTGKKEKTETALRHAVQKAEAALASAQREKEIVNVQLPELKAQLAALPAWESLSNGSTEWYRLEALYCMDALLPLLEENHNALIEQRNMVSGANVGKIYSFSEQAEISSAPEKAGERCKSYVLRLKAALDAQEIPMGSTRYFENPSAFLNAVIAVHNRRDRINEAIAQTESLLRRIPQLQKQLAD